MDEVTSALIAGIAAKVKTMADNAELRLNTVAESAAETIGEAVSNLTQAGHIAVQQAARRSSRLTAWPAIALTVLLAAVALIVAFVGGVYYGAGGRTVENRAITTGVLATWAVTPAGRAAYALDQANAATGGIRMFTLCSVPGWRLLEHPGRTLCMPYPLDADQARYQAWVLPRNPRPQPPKRP